MQSATCFSKPPWIFYSTSGVFRQKVSGTTINILFFTLRLLHIDRWQLLAEAEVDWFFAQQADPCIVEAARCR